MRRSLVLLAAVTALTLALTSCGLLAGRATVDMHLVQGTAPGVVVTGLSPLGLSPAGANYLAAQSFTPTKLEVPIVSITLSNGPSGMSSPLYTCSANTNDGCLVNLTQNLKAFQDIVNQSATVTAGTYDTVRVQTCVGSASGTGSSGTPTYTAYVTGATTIGATRYFTDASSTSSPYGLVSTGSGTASAVPITFDGCSRSFVLPKPLTLTDGQSVTLSLYIDLAGIAWIEDPTATVPSQVNSYTWIPGGCTSDTSSGSAASPHTPFVCMGYPDLAAVIGSQQPTLERYLVVDGSTVPSGLESGAMFGLFFDATTGAPLSGYTRRFYQQTQWNLQFTPDTPFKKLSLNANGSLFLENFGSSYAGPGYFTTSAFQRASHTGTFTDDNGMQHPYAAEKLPSF